MSKNYRPPYGAFSQVFAGPKEAKRMQQANKDYTRGFHQGRGNSDGRRR